MADAFGAYKEAFDSYKKNVTDYAVYSVLMTLASLAVFIALLAALLILGVLSAGSVMSLMGGGGGLTFGIAGIAATLAIVGVGSLVFLWLESGLKGAYLETINRFLTGGKQTFGGFFSAVPKRSLSILGVSLLAGICVGLPLVLFGVIAGIVGGLASYAIYLFGLVIALVIAALFMFAMPAVVVDNRGAVAAVQSSFQRAGRNFPAVIIFAIIGGILFLPAIILSILYISLFYLPVFESALLILYKKSR